MNSTLPIEIRDKIMIQSGMNLKKFLNQGILSNRLGSIVKISVCMLKHNFNTLYMKVLIDYKNFTFNDIMFIVKKCVQNTNMEPMNHIMRYRQKIMFMKHSDWKFVMCYVLCASVSVQYEHGIKWAFSNGKLYNSFEKYDVCISIMTMYAGTSFMEWFCTHKKFSQKMDICFKWARFHDNMDIMEWITDNYPNAISDDENF